MAFSSFPAIYLDHPNLQQFQLQQQQRLGSDVESREIHHHPSRQSTVAVVDGLTPPPGGGGSSVRPGSMVDRARLAKVPVPEAGLKCPRCDSSNTKFCYFNNYNLSQPRHFCKTCRRYWTRGGALRNVPVGGGCRRNKKTKNSSSKQAVINAVNSSACGNSSNNNITAPCPSISTTDMGMNLSSGFPNLPLMSAIQNLNHYSAVGPIGTSSLGGFPANMGLAHGGVDPWRLPPIGGYEQLSNNLFHFQGEGINTETASSTPVTGDQNLVTPADVKPEEIQAVNLRKQFQINPDHNAQFWSGNPWSGFSGHTSSSTNHLL